MNRTIITTIAQIFLIIAVYALIYTAPAQADTVNGSGWIVRGEFECDVVTDRNGLMMGVDNCELSDVELEEK